jgi:class 3 adenylate cyclase
MPTYLDRHELVDSTAAAVAQAHVLDLETQARYGVKYVTYFYDYDRQTAFCVAEGPSEESVEAVHRKAHGLVATKIMEIDPRLLELFTGPLPAHEPGEPYLAPAFRTILFTDIHGSTEFTQRLGDRAAMELVRSHDLVVRTSLSDHSGHEVKHTGDGIMASFRSVIDAVSCAITIQRNLAAQLAEVVGEELRVAVRIGIAAGEPVTSNGDLFGAAVQLAARLCDRAAPGAIVVSSPVRDLAIGKGFTFGKARSARLKGFDEAIRSFEVAWDS